MITINDVVDVINNNEVYDENFNYSKSLIQDQSEIRGVILRVDMLGWITKYFTIIVILFVLIFLGAVIFVISNVIKKNLKDQRKQIGSLKSLGYTNKSIVLSYLIFMMIPIIIAILLAWIIGIILQLPLMSIFNMYFNIPIIFSIDVLVLLAVLFCFGGVVFLVIFFTTLKTISEKPLLLLNSFSQKPTNLFLKKLFLKIRYKSLLSKLRFVLIGSSFKDLILFFLVVLFSSFLLTISTLIPNIISTMNKEFYKNIYYENDYLYTGAIRNNFITKPVFYSLNNDINQSNINASIFNVYINNNNTYLGVIDENSVNDWKQNLTQNYNLYEHIFEQVFLYNVLPLNNIVISPGVFETLIDMSQKIDNNNNTVERLINQFACQLLPRLFNQEMIDLSILLNLDYKYCIKEISGNTLASSIKELWDADNDYFKNFSFNFNAIPYSKANDEMYTRINASSIDNKTNILIYGLDLLSPNIKTNLTNLNLLKYQDNDEYIPVALNQKLKILDYKIDDVIELIVPIEEMVIKNNDETTTSIQTENWMYDNKVIETEDMTRFTYKNNEVALDNFDTFYYKDFNNQYKPYKDLSEVQLKIDISHVDKSLIEKVNAEYKDYSNKEIEINGEYIIVKPYDIFTYENNQKNPLDIISLTFNGTNTWLNIAMRYSLIYVQVDYKVINNLKVTAFEETYDNNKIYMDQVYANEILGFNNSDQRYWFSNTNSINMWSNAKLSGEEVIVDQLYRTITHSKLANNSLFNFDIYSEPKIGKTDYVSIQKKTINKLFSSSVNIIVFL